MPTKDVQIDIPIAGGVDTRTHPHHVAAPKNLTLLNVRFNQSGALETRNAYTTAGTLTALAAHTLTNYRGTLTAIATDGVYRYNGDTWVGDAYSGPRPIEIRAQPALKSTSEADLAYSAANGGYILSVWSNSADGTVWWRVTDAETGASLNVPQSLTNFSTSAGAGALDSWLQVIAFGSSKFCIIGRSGGAGTNFYYKCVQAVNGQVTEGSEAVLGTGFAASTLLYAHAQQDFSYFYAVRDGGNALMRFTESSLVLTLESTATITTAGTLRGVYHNDVSGNVVVFGTSAANNITTGSTTAGVTLPASFAAAAALTINNPEQPQARVISACIRDASGNMLVAWEGDDLAGAGVEPWLVGWAELDGSGTLRAASTTRVINNMRLHAHVYKTEDDSVIIPVVTPYDAPNLTIGSSNASMINPTSSTGGAGDENETGHQERRYGCLVEIPLYTDTDVKLVANYQPDIAQKQQFGSANFPSLLPHTYETTLGQGEHVFATIVQDTVTNEFFQVDGSAFNVIVKTDDQNVAVTNANNVMVISNGVVSSYDGVFHVEGWMPPPKFSDLETDTSVSAAISGDYAVRFTWKWKDNQGNLYRSAPSEPINVNLGSAALSFQNLIVNFFLPPPGFWNRGIGTEGLILEAWQSPKSVKTDAAGGGNVVDGVYVRTTMYTSFTKTPTTPSGSPVYDLPISDFISSSQPWETDEILVVINAVDDAVLANLYTNGNPGELDNDLVPSPLHMASSRDRLWMIDSEDRLRVYYTKPIQPEVAPGWNPNLAIRVPAEAGELTALGAQDETVFFFSESSIHYLQTVNGPDARGVGSFFPVRNLSREVGCVSRASVVTTDVGIFFQSRRGIMLIGRDMSLTFVGRDITDVSGTIVSATTVPELNQVLFTFASGGVTVYDYLEQQWSIYTPGLGTLASCSQLDGEHAVLDTDGPVYLSTANNWSSVVPSMGTGWIKLAGFQGFKRIKEIHILGRALGTSVVGTVTVSISYDYDNSLSQTEVFDLATFSDTDPLVIKIKPDIQKCQSIKFIVYFTPDGQGGSDVRCEFSMISLKVGAKKGLWKDPRPASS